MIEALVGFAAVLALVLLRMPIAFAMGLVGMLGYMYLNNYRGAISMVGRLIIDTTQNYGLSVVPLFILMGLFVNKGGTLARAVPGLARVSRPFPRRPRDGDDLRVRRVLGHLRVLARHRRDDVEGGDARRCAGSATTTACPPPRSRPAAPSAS